MSAQRIGSVKSGKSRKSYDVFWDSSDRIVYVGWGGKTNVGKANSASEAMNKAEAWLYDK
jgi:hypothetical protein